MLTDRGIGRLVTVCANVCAGAAGVATAHALGLSLWVVPAALAAGTIGWFVGYLLGRGIAGVVARQGVAPTGRPLYRLGTLPAGERTAGGKAQSLSRLVRAGERVPAGFVILPRAFTEITLKPEVEHQMARELARFRPGTRFAVRSSATAEDSADASFAGAYETLLDVPAEGVLAAILQVRASAQAARVAAYAAAKQIEAGDLAVVVQQLVPAESAGVLFTVHPLTGDLATMLGTAVTGLGEGVVSGDQTGEQFSFTRPSGDFTGPDSLRMQAGELHAAAHRIETCFNGVPQDIEWAVADGRVWILQARPITTLNPWRPDTAELNDSLAGNCLWSATNLSEANPEAQTPLTVSLARYQQSHGGPSMALRGREMAGFIGGRPYANLTVQITSRRGRPAKTDPRDVYQKLAGWWGDLPAQVPIPLLPMTKQDWTHVGLPLLGSLAQMVWTRLRLPAFLRSHRENCERLTGQVAACARPEQLLALWQAELLAFSLRSFWALIASGSTYPAALEARLREQYGAEVGAALVSNLSGLAGQLESLGPAAGLCEVKAGRLSRADYSARFGHRGVNEIELAWPRPAEDPGWLGQALLELDGLTPVAELCARQQAAYDAALGRVPAGQQSRVARQLRRAARHAALRETVRSEAVRTVGVMRTFALRAGELLGIGDDVFLLTIEELLAALAGGRSAFTHFEARREAHRRYRELPPLPGLIIGRFDPFAWAADPDRSPSTFIANAEPETTPNPGDESVITGYPGALGRVEGIVRRLDSYVDAGQLQRGEILVTQLTNIGWTPLFPRAGAIVTDLGAPLSHAAIVARELGIPAVVGCGDATRRLHTGDRVLVDGAAGRVVALGRTESPSPKA